MSGIDPGRRRIEEREAAYVAVGTRILDPHGVEYTVLAVEPDDDGLTLRLSRRSTGQETRQHFADDSLVRCRVDEDR